MGDVKHRYGTRRHGDQIQQLTLVRVIQGRQRLIQQQQFRRPQQGSRQSHPLAFPARQALYSPRQQWTNTRLLDHALLLPCRAMTTPGYIVQIALHGKVVKQGGLLRQHTDGPLPRRQRRVFR